jgi:predicted kinase
MLPRPTIVAVVGWPCSGKSAVAEEILKIEPMHLVDSDGTRNFALGGHLKDWERDENSRRLNQQEMALVYDIIHKVAATHAQFGRHLMITAPYTRPSSWQFLVKAIAPYPATVLKVIWCLPGHSADIERVKEILAKRLVEGYDGGCQTYEQYRHSQSQFEEPVFPHRKVATFTQSPAECARQALEYIMAP